MQGRPRGGQGGAARDPRPGPRDPPRGSWPTAGSTRRSPRSRPALRCRCGSRATSTGGRPRGSSRRPTTWSRRRWSTPATTAVGSTPRSSSPSRTAGCGSRCATTGRGGADPSRGTGLHGLRDRVAALGGTLERRQPARRADPPLRGAPMRVVLAEDSGLLRDALAAPVRLRHRGRAGRRHRPRPAASGEGAAARRVRSWTCGCRRLPRRGHPGGDGAPPPATRTRRLVLSQHVEERYTARPDRRRHGGARLPAQGPGGGRRRVRRVAAPGRRRRHRARPRGRAPAAGAPAPALDELSAARARGALADGRGPLERRDRPAPGGERRRGREARAQHPRKARPADQPTTTIAGCWPCWPGSRSASPASPRRVRRRGRASRRAPARAPGPPPARRGRASADR